MHSTIVRDDDVDAYYGDVEGFPIGSDIFPNVKISPDKKEIHLFGGGVPPGGPYMDLHYADSTLVRELQASLILHRCHGRATSRMHPLRSGQAASVQVRTRHLRQ